MPGNYSKLVTVTTGQVITAAERNNEHDNHITYATPAGVDDYSASTGEMQTQTDPYPASVESLATSLAGELARIRYVIAKLAGNTYWYEPVVIYHDRGDPSSVDFAVGALTVDAAWHSLDLSATVPDGAIAVALHVQITNGLAGQSVSFRRTSNSNAISISKLVAQVATVQNSADIIVPCDASRTIEYLATNGNTFSVLNITVKGYWR